jgi:tetratricopeptide (TPR) repeat protein
MGRERTRKGKHLLLYPACSIALLLGIWGCTHFHRKCKGEERLARAATLLVKGQYKDSMREAKGVLRLYPRTLGDKALFQMGLIYAYPKNPDQDYHRSLKRFQRVIKEFPKSDLKDQAKVCASVLMELMDKERKIGKLNENNSRLGRALEKEEKKVKELESQTEKLKSQAKKLKGQVEKLKDQVEKLKDQLLRLKEIDLGIEEKRSQAK